MKPAFNPPFLPRSKRRSQSSARVSNDSRSASDSITSLRVGQ